MSAFKKINYLQNEIETLNQLIARHKAAENALYNSTMLKQYERRLRKFYAEYCVALLEQPIHAAEMLPYFQQLTERIFTDKQAAQPELLNGIATTLK
jgi:chromosome condensin MukBEF MukE localization factor